jgi:hypothetical protein
MDGDGLEAKVAASPEDPQGDLPAIGDQNAVEHAHQSEESRMSGVPGVTGSPSATRMGTGRVVRGASTGLSIFIASI